MSSDPDGRVQSVLSETELPSAPDIVDSLVNVPTVSLVVVGPDSTVQWADESTERYFGSTDPTDLDWATFLDSHVKPCLDDPDCLPDQESSAQNTADLHVLPEAGRKERWLRHSCTPITTGKLAGGRLEQFFDVTAEHTRAQFEQYQSIAETVDDAILVIDSDWCIEYANPTAESQADRPLSERTGEPVLSVVDRLVAGDKGTDRLERAISDAFDGYRDGPATVELELETATGPECHTFDCKPVDGKTKAVITVRNVSEQRERERRYEALVNNFPNGAVTLVDNEMRYQLAGGKLFETLDETPEELEGMKVGNARPGDREVFVESYQKALNGTPATVETTIDDRVFLLRTFPVTRDGTDRAAVGMTQDITERKQRADELRWQSRALDEAPIGVTITDPRQEDNPMIYANQQFSDLSGYGLAEVLGRNCRFMQGENTDPEAVAQLREAIDDARPVSVELRNYRPDGTEFWNELHVAPVRDETGTVVNYVGFQQDVTDRKQRERKLRDVNQLLDIALTETGTGIWVLNQDDTVTSFGTTTDLFGFDAGPHDLETYTDLIHPDDRPLVENALATAREEQNRFDIEFRVETDDTRRWVHSRGTVSEAESGHSRMIGVVTDITDRKRRVRALEKRERVLNELHTATREFYPPSSLDEIAEFLVGFTENAFDVDYVSVKQYDEETGTLEPAVRSVSPSTNGELGTVSPGTNPVWESYRTGETQLFADWNVEETFEEINDDATQLLVAPVGDFGVMVAVTTARQGFDAVDVDLVEVLTANAESAFQRLRSDKVHTAVTEALSAQQSQVSELNGIIDSVQAVQRRLADCDSREALESGLCEELFAVDPVDFVWLGRPTGEDTDLSPSTWAGDATGYLDSVVGDSPELGLPARRAADTYQLYTAGNIAERVLDEPWAKDALSYQFSSVVSVPLVYEDVLYGVLTAYSRTENAFDGIYESLFTDVASLMVNYSRILDQQGDGSERMHTELEFELTDPTFPLQRLASATESTIRFDTVAERTTDQVRILVTVVDGDGAAVLDHASSMTSIGDAEWFGGVEYGQLSLLVPTPFFESLISKHGGRLRESVSDDNGTTFRIEIPTNVSQRPIFDSLTSRFSDIELVSKRQTRTRSLSDIRQVDDILTDRQCEILNAAFHGGYYETPRRVKGEDLAKSFDISGPAVYNHLQAAHQRLLEIVFEPEPENND